MTMFIRGACVLGMVALVPLAGCSKPGDAGKPSGPSSARQADGHPDKGPHGGALAEWGEKEEYHAEFTVDHKEQKATVYILDGSAKKAKPIEAKTITLTITNVKPTLTLTLEADPQKDDPEGMSSRFSNKEKSEKLGVEMDFKGNISWPEKMFSGEFDEKKVGHH